MNFICRKLTNLLVSYCFGPERVKLDIVVSPESRNVMQNYVSTNVGGFRVIISNSNRISDSIR
jgi:hypothetical protein